MKQYTLKLKYCKWYDEMILHEFLPLILTFIQIVFNISELLVDILQSKYWSLVKLQNIIMLKIDLNRKSKAWEKYNDKIVSRKKAWTEYYCEKSK